MSGERLNFAVGPVMMQEGVRSIGKEQVPYFRTPEFSGVMKENEELLKKISGAQKESRVVFLTGSGTAGMEMAVMNSFSGKDKVLIVNGGSFGERFEKLCEIYRIPSESILLSPGEPLAESCLEQYSGRGFTGMLVNMHETSTGVLYDMGLIGDFCRRNHIFLAVDAISAFLADRVAMEEWGIDLLILSSQKALALPPGMSFLVLGERALERAEQAEIKSLYFHIVRYLKDGERGQTPYTPAVSVLLQLNFRLRQILETGIENEIQRIHDLSTYFREHIKKMPFKLFTSSPSNAVTALVPLMGGSAYRYFEKLDKKYNIWVCPNGGALKDKVFRVGHIGDVAREDYDRLLNALHKIVEEEKNGAKDYRG